MKNKIEVKLERKHIIFLFIILILVIINSIIYIKYTAPERKNIESSKKAANITNAVREEKDPKQEAKENGDIKRYLSYLTERDRIEYYCGQFVRNIQDENYECAYNLLYPEFKNNYFPTIESFEEYIKKIFPEFFVLEYDDISRQGDIYVLRLIIYDKTDLKAEGKVERIVIQEKDYNDYSISLQVQE